MRASMFTYKGKKYIVIKKGTGRYQGMILFKRVRRFLWWYFPTREPAFWIDRSGWAKSPKKKKK